MHLSWVEVFSSNIFGPIIVHFLGARCARANIDSLHGITCALYIVNSPGTPNYILQKVCWKPRDLPKCLAAALLQPSLRFTHSRCLKEPSQLALDNADLAKAQYVRAHLPLKPDRDRLVPKGRKPAGRLNNSSCTIQKHRTKISTCSSS